jgi:hypothetical protein
MKSVRVADQGPTVQYTTGGEKIDSVGFAKIEESLC